MSDATNIFVNLLNEQVDVRRPVQAERVREDIYRIVVDQPYDRNVERWEFEPGDVVVCETMDSSDGDILVASRLSVCDN